MLLSAVSMLCVLLIGFAAHRASLCNVRAVAEIMTTGSGHTLWSIGQAVLWMAALAGVLVLGFGHVPQTILTRTPLAWALWGGWLFGVGAAVNGGCSLSTLHRLADGELGMIATIAGFLLGVSTWLLAQASGWPAELEPAVSPWVRWPDLAPWMLTFLLGWALLRLRWFRRLSRSHVKVSWRDRLLAPAYHLSISAAIMGLAGGLLYATQGAWSYTNFLRVEVLHWLGDARAPTAWHGILVGGLLAGMILSALQRRSLAWRGPAGITGWARHTVGGALMGAGAAMVPGGNDTVLLSGLPAMTDAAFGAYAFMLIGIASVLWAMKVARIPVSVISCTPSGCAEAHPAPVRQPGA